MKLTTDSRSPVEESRERANLIRNAADHHSSWDKYFVQVVRYKKREQIKSWVLQGVIFLVLAIVVYYSILLL